MEAADVPGDFGVALPISESHAFSFAGHAHHVRILYTTAGRFDDMAAVGRPRRDETQPGASSEGQTAGFVSETKKVGYVYTSTWYSSSPSRSAK